ncbi:MAG: hypothetical protein ABIL06_19340 [Pseudomonadota bacterium]|uniref:Uncharacterized protein n=1 Tax=viral metagenome TaxID=1070528 RepID=A0A6M3XZN1_9ZZZZ
MWTALAEVVIVLVAIAGALWGGIKYGETKQKKKDAEGKAEDMAHDAKIAAGSTPPRPLGSLRPKT